MEEEETKMENVKHFQTIHLYMVALAWQIMDRDECLKLYNKLRALLTNVQSSQFLCKN